VADGTMGGRILAVLVLTPLALHEVFASFTSSAQTFTRATGALNRVVEVLDAPPVGSGDSTKAQVDGVHVRAEDPPSLHIEGLAIGWPGHDPVLTGLDLDVAPGERVAVVGPSGIGKTTLAATVMGLIPEISGTVATTGRVRYLAQDAHVFATTIAENVKIGDRDATDPEVAGALAHAGLEMPLDRLVGEDGATLSGGEAQRLAMARVLAHHATRPSPPATSHAPAVPSPAEAARPELSSGARQPPLLILDEPTEHLDSETSALLMDDLWASAPGAAMLVITHDRDVMDRCDRVWRIG
jgi:ATP-binding cassette subfamily C protein CydC